MSSEWRGGPRACRGCGSGCACCRRRGRHPCCARPPRAPHTPPTAAAGRLIRQRRALKGCRTEGCVPGMNPSPSGKKAGADHYDCCPVSLSRPRLRKLLLPVQHSSCMRMRDIPGSADRWWRAPGRWEPLQALSASVAWSTVSYCTKAAHAHGAAPHFTSQTTSQEGN